MTRETADAIQVLGLFIAGMVMVVVIVAMAVERAVRKMRSER